MGTGMRIWERFGQHWETLTLAYTHADEAAPSWSIRGFVSYWVRDPMERTNRTGLYLPTYVC